MWLTLKIWDADKNGNDIEYDALFNMDLVKIILPFADPNVSLIVFNDMDRTNKYVRHPMKFFQSRLTPDEMAKVQLKEERLPLKSSKISDPPLSAEVSGSTNLHFTNNPATVKGTTSSAIQQG